MTISGTLNGDVYVFRGQVVVDGKVGGDLLVAGSPSRRPISISGPIQENLTVAGGNVELAPGPLIGGTLVAAAGNIHVAAPVKGGAHVEAAREQRARGKNFGHPPP